MRYNRFFLVNFYYPEGMNYAEKLQALNLADEIVRTIESRHKYPSRLIKKRIKEL